MSDKKVHFQPRKYFAFAKKESDAAIMWDRRVQDVLNFIAQNDPSVKESSSEQYFKIMEEGVENVERKILESRQGNTVTAIAATIRKAQEEHMIKRELSKLYEELGLDDFVEWCEHAEPKVDWDSFLDEYNLARESRAYSFSEKATVFLRKVLAGNKSLPTEDVYQLAVAENLIDASDEQLAKKQWNIMRKVAHEEHVTDGSTYGHWQLPSRY